MLRDTERHQLNTKNGQLLFENPIKIDNTHLLPEKVAEMVINKYHIISNEKDEREYRYGV